MVIGDAAPLNYLIQIESDVVLVARCGRVEVPATVRAELAHPRADAAVRSWIAQPPGWLAIVPDPPVNAVFGRLDPGARAALSLAMERRVDLVLIDDRGGRAAASRHGLAVLGTVGVLADAAASGLLDVDVAMARLRRTNFRLSTPVEDAARARLDAFRSPPR